MINSALHLCKISLACINKGKRADLQAAETRIKPVGYSAIPLRVMANEKGGTEKNMDIATLVVVVLVIAVALTFDFTNGFHDTANAMATSIATGALKPKTAVIAAGTLNLIGAFLSTEVAKTISGGIINEQQVTIGAEFIFAGLVGAILWNLMTGFGLPLVPPMRCSAAWWAR